MTFSKAPARAPSTANKQEYNKALREGGVVESTKKCVPQAPHPPLCTHALPFPGSAPGAPSTPLTCLPLGDARAPLCYTTTDAGGKNTSVVGGGAGINAAKLDAETEELKRECAV